MGNAPLAGGSSSGAVGIETANERDEESNPARTAAGHKQSELHGPDVAADPSVDKSGLDYLHARPVPGGPRRQILTYHRAEEEMDQANRRGVAGDDGGLVLAGGCR